VCLVALARVSLEHLYDMNEKDIERGAGQRGRALSRPPTGSSTEVDEKHRHKDVEKNEEGSRTANTAADDASDHGEPDIDHDDIEEIVAAHELDVELAKVRLSLSSPDSALRMLHRVKPNVSARRTVFAPLFFFLRSAHSAEMPSPRPHSAVTRCNPGNQCTTLLAHQSRVALTLAYECMRN